MNTAIKYTKEWYQSINQIEYIISVLPDDKLKHNYSIDRLKIDEWVAVSIFDGGFSSISYRDHWDNNCRILNRFYKKPSYRFDNKKRAVSAETLLMIEQQLTVSKSMGFDCAFMSRETEHQAFHHYKQYLPQLWFTPSCRYQMTESSYQYVMWTPLNSTEFIMGKNNGTHCNRYQLSARCSND